LICVNAAFERTKCVLYSIAQAEDVLDCIHYGHFAVLVAKEFNLVLILVHCFGFDDLFRKLGLDFYSWGLFMDHLARPRSRFYRTMPTITRLAVTGSMR
jgi:hypothetical protein